MEGQRVGVVEKKKPENGGGKNGEDCGVKGVEEGTGCGGT
jgi:hypothetical protein